MDMRSVWTSITRRAGVLFAAAGGALLCACGGQTRPEHYTTESGVVLSPDAEDPTARDRRRGVWIIREGDETKGTLDWQHPNRRTHGFGPSTP